MKYIRYKNVVKIKYHGFRLDIENEDAILVVHCSSFHKVNVKRSKTYYYDPYNNGREDNWSIVP